MKRWGILLTVTVMLAVACGDKTTEREIAPAESTSVRGSIDDAGLSAPTGPGKSAGPLSGYLPSGGRVPMPPGVGISAARFPNAHVNDPSLLPPVGALERAKGDPGRANAGNASTRGCYGPEVGVGGGYQPPPVQCIYESVTSTNGNGIIHHGVDPYSNCVGCRMVYVVDEMEVGRNSEWLAATINWFNSQQNSPDGQFRSWRPYFVYFAGGWLRAQHPAYNMYQGCGAHYGGTGYKAFFEFCLTDTGINDFNWNWDGYSRYTTGAARISMKHIGCTYCYEDYQVERLVVHEFGHMHSMAHDTDCTSVMTYCRTYMNIAYFWFTETNQSWQRYIYDVIYYGSP